MSAFMNIAHRGASAYAPENTFSAFDKALDMGTNHIELDVHFSNDGHIVVIHDETLDRTTSGTGPVASHTLIQLRSLDAGSWFAPQFTGERIPTLNEVLERYQNRAHLHIEIKARIEGLARDTVDLIRAFSMAERVTITSFQKERLEETRSYAPDIPAGWLVREWNNSIIPQAHKLGLAVLCPSADIVTPELVNGLHRQGFVIRAWGVGNEDLMRQVIDAGADGMTINFPDRLTDYLKLRSHA